MTRMTWMEKLLVNRPSKGLSNAAVVRRQLQALDAREIHHALELGCGAGEVTASLAAEWGYRAVGLDADPAQVALAHSRYGATQGVEFVVGDACDLDFPAAHFDLVVAQNVFHHLPDWGGALREIARVLRLGGHVLWLDLTPPAWLKLLLLPLRAQFGVYTLGELRAAFRAAGFIEVAVRQLVPLFPIRHELVLRREHEDISQ